MTQIVIKGLRKRFGGALALDGVDLTIHSGELLVLLGPSGCGKTTLLRCLAGLERPDEGEITIGDDTVYSSARGICVPPGQRRLGMVFQSYALWPHMTVRANIQFGLDVLKLPRTEIAERIDRVLADLSMSELAGRYPSELSGGQQQRVALARLLATKPPVFLMDEPLSNLDARLRTDMRVELKRFQTATESTTVYVTHDQTEAMTMSTRVVVMKDGCIQQVAAPRRLYQTPATTFVADFIGMPRINLIPLEMIPGRPGRYSNGDIELDLALDAPERVVIGARPEDVLLTHTAENCGGRFVVDSVLPNGPDTIVQLTRGGTSIIARVSQSADIEERGYMCVRLNPHALNVYDAATGLLIETADSASPVGPVPLAADAMVRSQVRQ